MLRRIAGLCGIASQLVVLTVLLIVVAGSPQFSWTENNISILGVEGPMMALFNWGLIITGVLSLIFAIGLGKSLLSSRLGKWGITSLVLGLVAFSAMGIFPRTLWLPHNVTSIAFFIFIILALLLIGIAATISSHKTWGLLSLSASIITITFWLVPWPWSGGAIPQLLYCLPWSLWTITFGVALLGRASPIDVKTEVRYASGF